MFILNSTQNDTKVSRSNDLTSVEGSPRGDVNEISRDLAGSSTRRGFVLRSLTNLSKLTFVLGSLLLCNIVPYALAETPTGDLTNVSQHISIGSSAYLGVSLLFIMYNTFLLTSLYVFNNIMYPRQENTSTIVPYTRRSRLSFKKIISTIGLFLMSLPRSLAQATSSLSDDELNALRETIIREISSGVGIMVGTAVTLVIIAYNKRYHPVQEWYTYSQISLLFAINYALYGLWYYYYSVTTDAPEMRELYDNLLIERVKTITASQNNSSAELETKHIIAISGVEQEESHWQKIIRLILDYRDRAQARLTQTAANIVVYGLLRFTPKIKESLRASLNDETGVINSPLAGFLGGLGYKITPQFSTSISLMTTCFSFAMIVPKLTSMSEFVALADLTYKSISTITASLRNILVSKLIDVFFTPLPVSGIESMIEAVKEDHSVVKHFNALVALFFTIPLMYTGGKLSTDKFESIFRAHQKSVASSSSLVVTLSDSIKWMLKWGSFLVTGVDPTFTSDKIATWYNKSSVLLVKHSDLTAVLEGIQGKYDFLEHIKSVTDTLVDEGTNHMRLRDVLSIPSMHTLVAKQVDALSKFSSRINVELCTLAVRKAPYAVCIVGSPGVGKSWVSTQIFNQYAVTAKLDANPENIYTFPSTDEYMTNFRSSQWGMILDDLGAVQAKVAVDKGLLNIINVINNVPMSSVQASIEDKGRHPVLVKMVVGTSNKMDLGARAVFNTAFAVLRRFDVFIEQHLKPEYSINGIVDPVKVADHENEAFEFKLFRAVNRDGLNKLHPGANTDFVPIMQSETSDVFNLAQLMDYLVIRMKAHDKAQAHLVKRNEDAMFCTECEKVSTACACEVSKFVPMSNTTSYNVSEVISKWDEEYFDDKVQQSTAEYYSKYIPVAIAVSGVALSVAPRVWDYLNSDKVAPGAQQPVGFWSRTQPVVFDNAQISCTPSDYKALVQRSQYVLDFCEFIGGPVIDRCIATRMSRNAFLTVCHPFLKGHRYVSLRSTEPNYNSSKNLNTSWESTEGRVKMHHESDCALIFIDEIGIGRQKSGMIKHLCSDPRPMGPMTLDLGIMQGSINPYVSFREYAFNSNNYQRTRLTDTGDRLWPVSAIRGITGYPGSCGSIVTIHSNTGPGQAIAGIVNATSAADNMTFFTPIDSKWILDHCQSPFVFSEALPSPISGVVPFYDNSSWNFNDGYHEPLYSLRAVPAFKTKCRPSPFFDKAQKLGLQPDRWVAPNGRTPVTDGVRDSSRAPVSNAIKGMKKQKVALRMSILDRAVDDLLLSYDTKTSLADGDYSPLSLHEAINGNDGLEPLMFSTSVGFPYVGPKSSRLVQNADMTWRLNEEDQKAYDTCLSDIQRGLLLRPVFSGTFKDAVISFEKAAAGKLRIFTGCPMIYTILVRQYFGRFIVKFKQSAKPLEGGEHVYGINHNTLDWDSLGKNLKHSLGAGDFKEFDKTLSSNIMKTSFKIMIMLMKQDPDAPLFNSFINDSCNPRVMVKGDVVDLAGTNPSGHPLTTLVNIIANQLLHRYVFFASDEYLKLGPDPALIRFDDHVDLVTYGDDSLFDTQLEWFNQNRIASELKAVCMTYTDANKKLIMPDFVTLDEAELLGRSFRKVQTNYGTRFIAPLKPESVVRMLTWRSPATALPDVLWAADVCRSAMMEIAKYEFVSDFDPKLLSSLKELYESVNDYLENQGSQRIELLEGDDLHKYLYFGDLPSEPSVDLPVLSEPLTPISGAFPGDVDIEKDQGVITFVDNTDTTETPSAVKVNTMTIKNAPASDMGAFLQRPLIISTTEWLDNTDLFVAISALTTYMTDPFIAPKIANFHLFRGNMRIRIVVNGSPTKVGGICVGWCPTYIDSGIVNLNGTAKTQLLNIVNTVSLPGPNFALDVCMNPKVEFSIPFLYNFDYMEVSSTDITNQVILCSYAPLRESGDVGASSVDITVYAWLEDVELVVPTPVSGVISTIVDKVMSSENDEDGPLSSISTAFANATGALTNVPGIGSYMASAQKGFGYLTKTFAFFGFSRPIWQQPVGSFTYEPLGNMVNTIAHDNTTILATDSRQAITMDLPAYGLPSYDPMAIMSIAARFSYLGTYEWFGADVIGQRIVDIGVTPLHRHAANALSVGTPFTPTSVCLAAWPFELCSFPMEYMFLFISSKFTSGMATISYDPDGTAHSASPSVGQYNTVVDLASGAGYTMVCINVPWSQGKRYKSLKNGKTSAANTYAGQAGIIYNSDYMNGSLRVSVRNKLKAAVNAECQVVVFVRAAPGFDVLYPDDSVSRLTPISGVGPIEDPVSGLVTYQVTYLGTPMDEATMNSMNQMYGGEKIVSFRGLLKRYQLWVLTYTQAPASHNRMMITIPPRPFPGWMSSTTTARPSHFGITNYGSSSGWGTNTTLQAYLRPAFYGEKGSQRWKVTYGKSAGSLEHTVVRRINNSGPIGPSPTISQALTHSSGTLHTVGAVEPYGLSGVIETTSSDKHHTSYAVPYYAFTRFSPTRTTAYNNTSVLPHMDMESMTTCVELITNSTDIVSSSIYTAAGDDYDLVHFNKLPTYSFQTSYLT